MKTKTEYSVVGQDVDEHFDTYEEAETFCKDLGKDAQMDVQFFSKEWEFKDGQWQEGFVEVIKNKGEHL